MLVSRYDHCLHDLLYRRRSGQLHVDIPAIVSNHPDLAPLAEWHGIPFHHVPVTKETKPEAERRMLDLVEENDIDFVVLARYMQILSEDACKALDGKAINIHHSFLPGFKGAAPYRQAHDRGVKLVGATAHYVTPDIESRTLARAVQWHTEHRVLLNGRRTVVFT
jgi:formyltetrahydrofolate deformylase